MSHPGPIKGQTLLVLSQELMSLYCPDFMLLQGTQGTVCCVTSKAQGQLKQLDMCRYFQNQYPSVIAFNFHQGGGELTPRQLSGETHRTWV